MTKTDQIKSRDARTPRVHPMNKTERYIYRKDPPDPKQIELCRRWLKLHCAPDARIDFEASAEGLKHNVERWCKTFGPHVHISEMSLIEAARECGYRAKMSVGGNFYFNMHPTKPAVMPPHRLPADAELYSKE